MLHISGVTAFTDSVVVSDLISHPFLAHYNPEIPNAARYFLKALWHIHTGVHGMYLPLCLKFFSISSTFLAIETHLCDTAGYKCHLKEAMSSPTSCSFSPCE
jgi:hypothetical protein